uniref:contractile injection system tape measure protein n=1 Tax=Ramlibacter sp. TaxID=1917967 RepID=UPI0017DE19E6
RWRQALAREAARSPRNASQALGRAVADAVIHTVAQAAAASPVASPAKAMKDKPPTRDPKPPAVPDPGEPIYVANAGMVLAEPFLPRLFALRGLLADDGKSFKDTVAAAKAAHLLQALVLGEAARGGSPEHELVLNKLMCGLQIADPLAWEGELAAEDLSVVDSLLGAMLQQWKVLGSTTVAGLRETFLRREGRLLCNDDHWLLVVEAGPFDMLVDQVPWGFSTIRFPWMERMIHVQWR